MPDYNAIARKIYDSFNNRRLDEGARHVAREGQLVDVPIGVVYHGPEGFTRFFQNWLDAFSDGKLEITSLVSAGRVCYVESIGRGTHTGRLELPYGTLEPTRRRVEMHGCDVLAFNDDGKLVSFKSYFDLFTMLHQLGIAVNIAAGQPSPEARPH